MRRFSLAALAIAVMVTAISLGAREAHASDVVPANAWCPVMPERAAKAQFTVEHGGVEIALCCRMCMVKFAKDPEAYLAVLEEMNESPPPPIPDTEEDDPAGQAPAVAAGSPALQSATQNTPALARFGRLHPVIVHFPIALLLVAAFAELLLAVGFLRASGPDIVRFCWYGGTASALAAGGLGWLAAYEMGAGTAHLDTHRYLGLASVAIAILGLGLEARARNREPGSSTRLWRVWLVLSTATVGATGHFGGMLVFGPDFFSF